MLEEPAKVSEDFLKKHPKGLGVEPRQVKGREVTEVLLLPVSHLGDFYQSKNAENRLGSGANKDYNQFTQSEDVILGDIVRKASSGGVSRAYLRAGPRKMLYFQPTEVRAAIVTAWTSQQLARLSGDFDWAIVADDFERAIQVSPYDPKLHLGLADAARQMGDSELESSALTDALLNAERRKNDPLVQFPERRRVELEARLERLLQSSR